MTNKIREIEAAYNYCIARDAEGDWAVTEADGPWNGAAGTYDTLESAFAAIQRHFDEKFESRFDIHDPLAEIDDDGNTCYTVAVDQYEPLSTKNKFKYTQHAQAEAIKASGTRYAWVSDGTEGYICAIGADTTEAEVAADFLVNYDGPTDFAPEVEIHEAA